MASLFIRSSIAMAITFSHLGHAQESQQKLQVPVSKGELQTAVQTESERLSAEYVSVEQTQLAVQEKLKDLEAIGSTEYNGQTVKVPTYAVVAMVAGLGSIAVHTATDAFQQQQLAAQLLWKKITMQSVEYRGTSRSLFNYNNWARVADAVDAEKAARTKLHAFINKLGGPFSDLTVAQKHQILISFGNEIAPKEQAARYANSISQSQKARLYILNRNYVLARLGTITAKAQMIAAMPLIALFTGFEALRTIWQNKFLVLGGGLMAYSYLNPEGDGRQVAVKFNGDLRTVNADLEKRKEKIIGQLSQLPLQN